MAANAHDLLLAILQIGAEDTDAGGLVDLTDSERPIRRWRAETDWNPPVVAVQVGPARRFGGAPDKWVVSVTFDALAPAEQDGLEWDLLDRIEERLTHDRLLAKGLDAAVSLDDEDTGPDAERAGDRAVARYEVELTR